MASANYSDITGRVIGHWSGGGGGGSIPWKVLDVPIAFDTAGILTGLALGYTPTVGDWLIALGISITTAWDGTFPGLGVYLDGFDPLNSSQALGGADLTIVDSAGANGTATPNTGNLIPAPLPFTTSAAILAKAYDGNTGGDPGSAQGEGRITVLIAQAAA